MNRTLGEAYWALVRECLVRFHRLSAGEAGRRVCEYVRHLRRAPADLPVEIVYNIEAFDLACDLAERDLDWEPLRDEYFRMMDRQFEGIRPPPGARIWPPELLPTV